ncbi:MAG: nitroreductase family protein [Tannerella sp.]|jgi:nitroreductase|nr:nitroreductase family protein [Tannerella sp.]
MKYYVQKIGALIFILMFVCPAFSQITTNETDMKFNNIAMGTVSKKDATLSVIHSRKSVRNFIQGKTVPRETLDTVVRAGMAAASAVNLQPWQFIVIDDRTVMDSLAAGLPYAKMLYHASAAIVVCGDSTVKAGEFAFWEFDCSLASGNILLAVEAMGLGAVWTAVHPDKARVSTVRKILHLPENIIPLNVIPIGYPAGNDKPKDKYKPDKIHWNGY